VTEITKNNLCITNSEGNELTSTFFITSNLTIEVTDVYNLKQLLRGLLELELLRRTFNRGVKVMTLHHFSRKKSKILKKPIQRGARSVFAHHPQISHLPKYSQPSSGTFKGCSQKIASKTGNTKNAETPLATQQAAAILHRLSLTQSRHVSNQASIFNTQNTSISIGDTYVHDFPYQGQGHTNISWK